jgi:hypothetical protein
VLAIHEPASDRLRVLTGTATGPWRHAATIEGAAHERPVLAVGERELHLGWRSTTDARLGLASSTDGRRWKRRLLLRDRASTAPGLVAFDNDLVWCWGDAGGHAVVLRHGAPSA